MEQESFDKVRNEFEELHNKSYYVVPVSHGEVAFASWEYQLWLERELLKARKPLQVWYSELIDFINTMTVRQSLLNGEDIDTIHVPSLLHKVKELSTLPAPAAQDKDAQKYNAYEVQTMFVSCLNALKVLRTMLDVAKLDGGREVADQMIIDVNKFINGLGEQKNPLEGLLNAHIPKQSSTGLPNI